MNEGHLWALLALAWVFGWATVWLLRKRSREAYALKRREMVHAERMAAIEKGLPLPELPADEETPEWLAAEIDRVRTRWLQRTALALGLLATATGIGLCVAFYWAPDRGFRDMWTVGLIPMLGGLGCLLFWRISTALEPPA